jgi:hypothetical protein
MKFYVITIQDLDESNKVADRCIASAAEFGIEVEKHWAFTPEDNEEILQHVPVHFYNREYIERFSRYDRVVSTFLSHYYLWTRSHITNTTIGILEHDSVFTAPLPEIEFDKCINIGKPSFGAFSIPSSGVGPLTSKRKFPGAHAYLIKPEAALAFMYKAQTHATSTDVFINLDNFPWLQELYPWPVEVQDSFTTIQKKEGCLAKHNYGLEFKII